MREAFIVCNSFNLSLKIYLVNDNEIARIVYSEFVFIVLLSCHHH